ncbi:unnamed protein product [Clonostachys byssicola]|uniref:Uncharacterized protein n=1 Tax=Clonostachys byssicola TaxID=160290 RepID=A0A9N9U2U4_9HYPO|nr:unnamed protein product [Clonostachys byssicola]
MAPQPNPNLPLQERLLALAKTLQYIRQPQLQPNFPTIPPTSHLARICETPKHSDHENIGKMIPLT